MKKFTLDLKLLLIILLVVLVIFSFFSFTGKDCKDDFTCYTAAVNSCSKARVYKLNEDNVYEYRVLGGTKDVCKIKITLIEMKQGTSYNLIQKFEGKSMTCTVPRDVLRKSSLENVNNLVTYCTGPLKEAIYELLVEKMYSLIIANLEQYVDEIDRLTQGVIR